MGLGGRVDMLTLIGGSQMLSLCRIVRFCALLFFLILGCIFSQTPSADAVTITEYNCNIANCQPAGITVGPDGNLWFTDSHLLNFPRGDNIIGKITPAGMVSAVSTLPIGLGIPVGITSGPDGNLWFAAYEIGKISATGAVTGYPISTSPTNAHGITPGPDGNLWFTEWYANKIGKITTSGVVTEYIVPTSGGHPSGITTGPDGNLWLAEDDGNKIAKITTTGVFTEYAVPTNASRPSGITVGPDGNLWFAEFDGLKIGKIATTGVITEYVIPSGGHPSNITAGPDGNLWFTETYGNKIGKITTAGVITEYAIPTSNSLPEGITTGPDGNIWFTENAGGIGRISGFQLPVPTAVPTMTEWGMIFFMVLAGIGSVYYLKRQHNA